ncbi:MAG: recombination mediator RecR [Christensenellales bacterium]|jgi:recombination protein RecR
MREQEETIEKLIASFRLLPGVGYKTAQRYAYSIIEGKQEEAEEFAQNILDAKNNIHYCKECGNFTDKEICKICQTRSAETICVVKDAQDVVAMEKIKNFNGVYHVLHGTISPLENRGPNDIKIKELIERVVKHKTKEVVLATNPDVEGDVTAHYIANLLKPLSVKATRLAQGISMGTDIEYADEITLTRAFEARSELN